MTDARSEWGWDDFAPLLARSLGVVLGERVDEVGPSSHLLDDVGLDSFGVLVLLDELETQLGVSLPAFDEEPTAGRICDLVATALGRSAASSPGR